MTVRSDSVQKEAESKQSTIFLMLNTPLSNSTSTLAESLFVSPTHSRHSTLNIQNDKYTAPQGAIDAGLKAELSGENGGNVPDKKEKGPMATVPNNQIKPVSQRLDWIGKYSLFYLQTE